MESEVPFIRGGTYDPADAERHGCRLIWWPEELLPPFIDGERGSRTIRPESVKLTLGTNGYECDPALLALETALARVATLEGHVRLGKVTPKPGVAPVRPDAAAPA